MEQQNETSYKNMFVPICITQTVCVAVILIAVLIIRFFFADSFVKLQNWHKEYFMDETDVTVSVQEEEYEI